MVETVCVHISLELLALHLMELRERQNHSHWLTYFTGIMQDFFIFPFAFESVSQGPWQNWWHPESLQLSIERDENQRRRKIRGKIQVEGKKRNKCHLALKYVAVWRMLHCYICRFYERVCVCLCSCMCTAAAQMKNDWFECFCLRRPNRAQKLKCSLWLRWWLRTLPLRPAVLPSSFFISSALLLNASTTFTGVADPFLFACDILRGTKRARVVVLSIAIN